MELRIDRATIGLSVEEAAELEQLLKARGESADIEHDPIALAAAAADVGCWSGAEFGHALPPELAQRVMQRLGNASAFGSTVATNTALANGEGVRFQGQAATTRWAGQPQRRSGAWAWSGWSVAALLAIACGLIWQSSRTPGAGTGTGLVADASTKSAQNQAIRQSLAALRRTAADVVVRPWTRGPDSTGQGCSGEVVWSASKQEGYMVFRGLAANDPRIEQYQLWIFDADRDERYPVHGGVFDIAQAGPRATGAAPSGESEIVVRIEPRLNVKNVAAFVVTVEKPGGVWVSDRKRIPVLAKVSS